MISALRIGASKMLELIVAKNSEGIQNVTKSDLVKLMLEAGIPVGIHKYDGGFYERNYIMLTGPFTPEESMDSVVRAMGTDELAQLIFKYQLNRMKYAAWFGYLQSIDDYLLRAGGRSMHWSINSKYLDFGQVKPENSTEREGEVVHLSELVPIFTQLAGHNVSIEYLKAGLRTVINNQNSYNLMLRDKDTNKKALGLSTLFDKKPLSSVPSRDDVENIKNQVRAAYAAMPSNALTSRTWGYEVEIADAKGVDAPFGIEKGEDGSLRSYESSSDCDCDCDECMYHDCDCDNCDSRNTDPDHCNGSSCSSADMAEFRTKNGVSRLKHAGLFKLCSELSDVDAEVNDTCGIHIHVYAQDLETKQVANVLAGYKWLENIMAIIAGRDDVNYAKRLPIDYIKTAFAGKLPIDKPRAVNVSHAIGDSSYSKGTIEFRQMAGGIDAEWITIWAWTVRGLVEVCSRGAELKDFINITDFNGLVEMYAKFNYTLHDEGAKLLIPGGQQDNKYITRMKHERA
jgi:hypothetical protein